MGRLLFAFLSILLLSGCAAAPKTGLTPPSAPVASEYASAQGISVVMKTCDNCSYDAVLMPERTPVPFSSVAGLDGKIVNTPERGVHIVLNDGRRIGLNGCEDFSDYNNCDFLLKVEKERLESMAGREFLLVKSDRRGNITMTTTEELFRITGLDTDIRNGRGETPVFNAVGEDGWLIRVPVDADIVEVDPDYYINAKKTGLFDFGFSFPGSYEAVEELVLGSLWRVMCFGVNASFIFITRGGVGYIPCGGM